MNLKLCRIKSNVSQKEISEKLGVTINTVSRWETGKVEPSIKNILELSKILSVTTDELLGK